MISEETIEVNVTYGKRYTFHLIEVGIADEQKLRQKTFGLKEAEKAEKEYAANVQLLADLSVDRPTVADPDDAESKPEEFDLKEFFAERTPRKERIAYFAVRGYFTRLLPGELFL
jgi:hypothetical protein